MQHSPISYRHLPISYRQLRNTLNKLSEEQLDMSVSTYDHDAEEVYPVYATFLVSELPQEFKESIPLDDENHPVLLISCL